MMGILIKSALNPAVWVAAFLAYGSGYLVGSIKGQARGKTECQAAVKKKVDQVNDLNEPLDNDAVEGEVQEAMDLAEIKRLRGKAKCIVTEADVRARL